MKKFMFLVVLIIALFLVACKDTSSDKEVFITITELEVELDFGDEYMIQFDTNAIESLNWESTDTNVITVEDGLVKAVGEGFAEIIVSYGDVNETIFFHVKKEKFVPEKVVLTIDGDPVEVLKNSIISAALKEYYDGNTHVLYDDASFEGWFSDPEFINEVDIDSFITENLSLYPKFEFIEINCELKVYFDKVVGEGEEFDETLNVQNIIPTYGTYFEISDDLLEKFLFVSIKYDVNTEDYVVIEIISEACNYLIPSNGFVVSVSKDCDEYDTYRVALQVGEKITLSTYSALTAKALYVNEIVDASDEEELDVYVTTKYCSVYDVRSKTFLYQKSADTKCWPASTTKVITAIAALKYASLDDTVTIGDELDICYEGSDPSVCGLKKGEVWSLEDLLYGLLLPSGNDAGYGIAALTINKIYPNNTFTGKEKVEMFADLMNEVASECGALNSNFYTPDGNSYYNSDGSYQDRTEYHYVTANDMVRIAVYAFSFPAICKVVRTSSITVKLQSGESKSFSITNALVKKTNANYYEGAVGLKTGTTNRAGACLVSGVERARRFVIVASLGNPTSAERYTNTLAIFRSIYK